MLKHLSVKNLVLIEEVEIPFTHGLNIITGETGAGKTALITALKLLLGERADPQKVRQGCEKALVQAIFQLPEKEEFWVAVDDLPITLSREEDLILTREVSAAGKSRAFIAGQQVPAAILQKLTPFLLDFIGQHAHIELKSPEKPREYLDLFAGIDLSPFQTLWEEEKRLRRELETLIKMQETAEQKKQDLQQRVTELDKANIQEGEEDALFEELGRLSHVQELALGSIEVIRRAEEALSALLPSEKVLEKMMVIDPSIKEVKEGALETHLQLQEMIHTLQSYLGKLESNPQRLASVEERLKEVVKLKKKYGKDLASLQKEWKEDLEKIENLGSEIEAKEADLIESELQTAKASSELTEGRKRGGKELEQVLERHLREMNIPKAKVEICHSPAPRTKMGDDEITFHLFANVGEKGVGVRENMSGGELSRLFFSLKIALSSGTTMVFDEIDANVGGETAAVVGKKLQELGKKGQVICITHFPQVAKFADHHLRVFKEEVDHRTVGKVEPLSPKNREEELIRMRGGAALDGVVSSV